MSQQKDQAGLTETERDFVRNTWELVRQDVPGNGSDLFLRLFDENPEYQALFKAFKSVPKAELRYNKRFVAHVTNVMYTLSMIVDNIDETEVLVEMLTKMADNHRRHKSTVQMFVNLKTSLFGLLTDKLGPNVMTADAVNAWDKTYSVIVSPSRLLFPGGDHKIRQVHCGDSTSFAVTTEGLVFGWGRNDGHQLGHNRPDPVFGPLLVEGLHSIHTVCPAPPNNTYFMTENGLLYFSGKYVATDGQVLFHRRPALIET
ncbi:unnamed protein product, partial [Medioppia subpectinata]